MTSLRSTRKRSDPQDETEELREKIIGLGERSFRKSYYPELRKRLADLERFKTLLDQSNDAIFLMEYPSGRFTDVTKSACRQIGYPEEDCLSKTMYDIVPGGSEELDRLFSGETESLVLDTKILKGDGAEVPYEINLHRVRFSNENYVVAVARDITLRKQTEESLKLTQFALDKFSDSAIWVSPDGRIVYVNETACNRLGYSREELLSMHIWDIDSGYRPDKYKEAWEEIKREGGTRKFESQHVTRDGRIFPVDVACSYISYGNKEYLISFDRDITERKQAEQELIESKTQAELYLDLMGHDINNINQIAMGFLELAHDKLEDCGKLGVEDSEFISLPIESLKNSARLIDNLRKIQKEKSGAFKLETISVNRLLKEVEGHFSPVPGRDVTITFRPACECLVQANKLLKDVFMNIVDNSVRHSKDPVIINISMAISGTKAGKYCTIAFEDNGPGIADDRKASLFDFSSSIRQKIAGKGLGLYIVKTLLDDFRGNIRVEDRVPGDHTKGTRFIVNLPLARP
jgi:PAS domain S-box-containing protein